MYCLTSPGTNAESSELTDWLRENGADEDTISRVKKTLCGKSILSLRLIVVECLCAHRDPQGVSNADPALPS